MHLLSIYASIALAELCLLGNKTTFPMCKYLILILRNRVEYGMILKPGFHMIATIGRNDRKSGFHMIATIATIAAIVGTDEAVGRVG